MKQGGRITTLSAERGVEPAPRFSGPAMRDGRRVYGPIARGMRNELGTRRYIGDGAISNPAPEMIPGTPRAGF